MSDEITTQVVELYEGEQMTEDIIAKRLNVSVERVTEALDAYYKGIEEETEALDRIEDLFDGPQA